MLSIIVAFDEKNGIGKDGWMPWDLPEDLKLFKKYTLGKTLIMGNATFQSLKGPLPNRKTIVLTRYPLTQPSYKDVVFTNDYLKLVEKYQNSSEEVFVSGGAKIYELFLPYAKRLYISHVKNYFPADTFFPKIAYNNYQVIFKESYQDFDFKIYQKKEGLV